MSEKEEHRRDTEKRITEKQAGGKKKNKKTRWIATDQGNIRDWKRHLQKNDRL